MENEDLLKGQPFIIKKKTFRPQRRASTCRYYTVYTRVGRAARAQCSDDIFTVPNQAGKLTHHARWHASSFTCHRNAEIARVSHSPSDSGERI